MRWLSERCVALRCPELINNNYTIHRSVGGQFSVPKPYQATATTHSEASTHTGISPEPDSRPNVQSAGQKRASEEDCLKSAEEAADKSNTHPSKRRRKGQSDPQAAHRQGEAQQRHDARQPSLSYAYQLLRHFLSEAGFSTDALQALQLSDMPALTIPQRSADSSSEQHDSLDLLALQKLKYTVHPKFAFVAEGEQSLPVNLFGNLICNESNQEALADAFGHAILVPAQAAFLLSDVTQLKPLLPGQHRNLPSSEHVVLPSVIATCDLSVIQATSMMHTANSHESCAFVCTSTAAKLTPAEQAWHAFPSTTRVLQSDCIAKHAAPDELCIFCTSWSMMLRLAKLRLKSTD